MFKKSLLIFMLAMGLALVFAIEASALTCSRCRRSPWGLCMNEVLKALGNVQKNVTFSDIDIQVEQMSIESWCNHGDGCGGDPGQPFSFESSQSLTAAEQVSDQLVNNGKAYVDQYIPGCFIWDFMFCAGDLDYGPDANGDGIADGVCVQYACLEHDAEGKCIVWDYDNCLYYGGVCPAETGYDYSVIPEEGYPANGNTNWFPESPYCDPQTQPLGSLDHDGNVIIERMWVTSLKTVWDCPKGVEYPDPGCVASSTVVDEACLELNADNVTYDKAALSNCSHYVP